MAIPTALDGSPIEVGAKFFLRSGQLVTITECRLETHDTVIIAYTGWSRSSKQSGTRYNMEGEIVRTDYDTEHDRDIMSLHSYKAIDFSKAIRQLEAKGQALRA